MPIIWRVGLAVDNPYYAVTGQEGRFVVTDVSPCLVWHPQIGGMKEYQITVELKVHAKLHVTYEAPNLKSQ